MTYMIGEACIDMLDRSRVDECPWTASTRASECSTSTRGVCRLRGRASLPARWRRSTTRMTCRTDGGLCRRERAVLCRAAPRSGRGSRRPRRASQLGVVGADTSMIASTRHGWMQSRRGGRHRSSRAASRLFWPGVRPDRIAPPQGAGRHIHRHERGVLTRRDHRLTFATVVINGWNQLAVGSAPTSLTVV